MAPGNPDSNRVLHRQPLLLLAIIWLVDCQLNVSLALPETTTLRIGDARIHVFIDDNFLLSQERLVEWIEESALVVSNYYHRFPVERVYVALRAVPGAGVKRGRAVDTGPTINVTIGLASTESDIVQDWVLVHEMVHLAFPGVPDRHHWIEEGLAVYVESIARAKAGRLSPTTVWQGFMQGMPHGLPRPGDRGLDFTPTWGRIYWGGALFCLLADIQIRRDTGGVMGLREALRGVVTAGFNMTRRVPSLDTVLTTADRAVGGRVISELYNRLRASPEQIDLDALWRRLGIVADDAGLRFEATAPWSAIRAQITRQDPVPVVTGRIYDSAIR